MKACLRHATLALSLVLGAGLAGAQAPSSDGLSLRGAVSPADPAQLRLTPTQKTAIVKAVREKSATLRPPTSFSIVVGEMVPPSIELYMLPDNALAEVPEAKSVKYTVLQNQVVLVDPTNMRIVDVLR
jgi:Protein of unknown function (DUF1236)